MKASYYTTLISLFVGFLIGYIHGGIYGYLAFISLQLTAILPVLSASDSE